MIASKIKTLADAIKLFGAIACLFLAMAAGNVSLAQEISSRHGVIEIGASGVKAAAWTVAQRPQNGSLLIDSQILPTRDVTGVSEQAIMDVVNAVDAMAAALKAQGRVPEKNIHIYASSGINNQAHGSAIVAAVSKRTGKGVNLLSQQSEAEFVFQETVLYKNRTNQVLVIDIGSGNTKIAYHDADESTLVTVELPYGAKTFAKQVDNLRGSEDFVIAAARLKREILVPAIRDIVSRRPAIRNLSRVYLAGGTVFATATLLHPEGSVIEAGGRNPFHQQIWANDFDTLYRRLVTVQNDDAAYAVNLKAIKNPTVRDVVAGNVQRIRKNIFTREQLIAGLEIARALSDETKMNSKTLFFSKDAQTGLMRGYLLNDLAN